MGPFALGGSAESGRGLRGDPAAGPALGFRTPTPRVEEGGPTALPEEASVLQVPFWGLGEPGLCQVLIFT